MARRASPLLVGLWLLHAVVARAEPGGAPSPCAQRYTLRVELLPQHHALAGAERIHFENTSRATLTHLYFHLYPNAFEGPRTVFMREQGARLRGLELESPGRIELRQLHTTAGQDLLPTADFELVTDDHTQLRVALPAPLPPGAALELELRFRTQLPSLVARAGFSGDFFMVAQFFPKLAKLEPTGTWVSFPYHGLGEFYADFACYTLQVRAPRQYVIASAGSSRGRELRGDAHEETFVAERVHDVAFAAYPYFVRHDFAHAGVSVRLFAPRGYAAAVSRQVQVIRAGLSHFGRLFGPYPYATLTVILPPRHGYGAAGMEYPGLFVSDGPWWRMPLDLPDPAHDFVAAHELAHQWFSAMIASNEVRAPVLDEGLAQWATFDLLRELYSRSAALAWLGGSGDELFDVARALFAWAPDDTPSSLLAAHHYRRDSLAHAAYMRPAVVLDAIERQHGRARLLQALGHYARTHRFGHPALPDLFAAFDGVYGAGFSQRELEPALAGRRDDDVRRAPPERGRSLLSILLFGMQALLHWMGP